MKFNELKKKFEEVKNEKSIKLKKDEYIFDYCGFKIVSYDELMKINSKGVKVDYSPLIRYIPLSSKCKALDELAKELHQEQDGDIIQIEKGYASIDKFNYELFTMSMLAQFYCGIEFDDGIDSDDYDWLYENKFKLWLRKITEGDSNNFINNFFNLSVQSEIDKINSLGNAIKSVNEEGLLDITSLGSDFKGLEGIDPENLNVMELVQELIKKKQGKDNA
jgi:hypothetical protein